MPNPAPLDFAINSCTTTHEPGNLQCSRLFRNLWASETIWTPCSWFSSEYWYSLLMICKPISQTRVWRYKMNMLSLQYAMRCKRGTKRFSDTNLRARMKLSNVNSSWESLRLIRTSEWHFKKPKAETKNVKTELASLTASPHLRDRDRQCYSCEQNRHSSSAHVDDNHKYATRLLPASTAFPTNSSTTTTDQLGNLQWRQLSTLRPEICAAPAQCGIRNGNVALLPLCT